MRGVDLFDQKSSYYSIQLRSKRWYMKILFHMIDISLVNAHIIYSHFRINSNKIFFDQIEFRKAVVRELVSNLRTKLGVPFTEKKKKNNQYMKRESEGGKLFSEDKCELHLIPQMEGRRSTVRDCQIHKDQGSGRQQTSYWCKNCETPVCPVICYDRHRKTLSLKQIKLTFDL